MSRASHSLFVVVVAVCVCGLETVGQPVMFADPATVCSDNTKHTHRLVRPTPRV